MKKLLLYTICALVLASSQQAHAGVKDYALSFLNTCKQIPIGSAVATLVGSSWSAMKNHPYLAATCSAVVAAGGYLYAKKLHINSKLDKAFSQDYSNSFSEAARRSPSRLGAIVRRIYRIKDNDSDTALKTALENYENAFIKGTDKEEIIQCSGEISDLLKKRSIVPLLLTQ